MKTEFSVETVRKRCRKCGKPAATKGYAKGRRRLYRNLCEVCRRRSRGGGNGHAKRQLAAAWRLKAGCCVLCGWSGPCDHHRIVFGKDGGEYTKGNVLEVCPNCHRLIHLKMLRLEHEADGPKYEQMPLLEGS